jgi:hypothetical protein
VKRRARGEVPVRLIVFGLVGIALVALPLWFLKKDRHARTAQTDAAERAAVPPAPVASPPDPTPDRYGVTFGWWAASSELRAFALSCTGSPRPSDNPLHGECNAQAGDTSCRTSLPMACVRPTAPNELALAITAEVPGFALRSRAAADARCAADFGAGWRMAGFLDSGNGEVRGTPIDGLDAPRHRRVWVAVDHARANCWDAPP